MNKLLVFVSAFGLGLAALGAPKGSCESAAASITVGGSVAVRLVGEYDPEDGTTSDSSGVYYLAVTLTRGQSYTLSYTGGNADDVTVSAYPREETDSEFDRDIYAPMAGFDEDAQQGSVYASWLYSSDWDEEDPSSWKYYICVEGAIGATTTVTLQQGIKNFIPEGYEDNPKSITFSDTERTLSNLKITEENSYYLEATLKGGRKYLIRTTGGTDKLPLSLQVSSEDNYGEEDDPEFAADTNNTAIAIYPETGGLYTFEVYGAPTNTPFGLVYRSIPVRPIGEHPVTDLAFDEPQTFVPGAENATLEFYDDIIDAELFRVTAAKGDRLVFDATGADRSLTMRLYDAKGNVLAQNQTIGDGSLDTRIGYTATAAGTYYVGVCDNLLEAGEAKVCAETTILARKAGNEDGKEVAISPLPGKATDNPVTAGAASGPYKLGFNCWSQTFVIGARKDITYVLATSFAGDTSNLGLKAEVFTKSGSSEQKQPTLDGDEITPGMALAFTAKANKAYYVRISVEEGKSLEFPEFNVHALAYSESGELGILTVKTYGAPGATWYLDRESSYPYPGGTSILVDNSSARTVTFKSVTNFKLPDPSVIKDITIIPGKTPTEVEGYYTDKADPADATTPASWTLRNTMTSFDRTLWTGDEADKFAIAAKAGYFYDFALSEITGDAVFAIVDAKGDEIVSNVTSVSKLALPDGKCVLTVSHGQSPAADGSYTISGKFANVGTIKLAKTAVSVKEDAANVAVSVSRTAKDGRVRVRYGTVAGTAVPGVDYVAQSGVLEWADGDNKAQTVAVKLIPDLVPIYEGANKQFEIKFEPIPEDDREEDEYAAVFAEDTWTKVALDTVTVTLTEATRASAGTVQVVCTTPKKPVYTVEAGAKLSFELERRDAADGAIEVKVDASAIGGDIQTFEWADGESGKKPVEIDVPTNEQDYKTTKNGTVKLTATSAAKPKFTASSITVTVVNEKFEMTAAEWGRTSEGKTCGYALREAKSGTWFKAGENTFTNLTGVGALTITVTGPCVFEYSVDGISQEPVEVELGKAQAVDILDGSRKVVFDYKYNDDDYKTVLQGVKYGYETFVFGSEARTVRVTQGRLPDGIKLEKDREDDCWYVRGVPTKAGYFYAVITDTTTPSNPIEQSVVLRVDELGTAVGVFNGIINVDGPSLTEAFPSLGTVQLTTTAAGRLTAKVAIGGKSYNFSGTGFDEVEDDADIDGAHRLTATLTLAQKIAGNDYVDELTLSVLDAKADDLAALGSVFGAVNLTMAIPTADNKDAQADVAYTAELYRDNTKNADYVAAFAAFTGYYTVALPIVNPDEGKPQGNGYLTVTVDDKGKAKVAGKLADGTAVSSALIPALIGNLTAPRACELVIPVYLAKKPCVFGGILHVRVAEDGTAVVDSAVPLRWANDNAALTYYGEEGWNYELSPCGGWYDTVYNLQAFFLNNTFAFDAGYSDDLPEELAKGYDFVSSTMPTENAVDLQGNNLVAEKQTLVKDAATRLNDFDRSINPSGIKVSFKRATGVVNGTFNVWTEGTDARGNTVQKSVTGFKHEGILLLSRDEAAPLDEQIWTAGYFLAPSVNSLETGKKYVESRQFNIISEDHSGEDAWAEDWGWNPEWGEEPAE